MRQVITSLLTVLIFTLSYAHVEIVFPKGGESFQSGEVVNIQWANIVVHDINYWEVQLSMDSGISWQILQSDISGNLLQYEWNVPNLSSGSVRLRVIQVNTGANYDDSTNDFTITSNNKNPLLIPPTISGEKIQLILGKGNYNFYPDVTTATMGINGDVLGPTIILDKGQYVDISVENQIGERTTIHWHGLHVAPANDGGPHTVIEPGEIWNPQFNVLDHASTYWYHPHLHEKTNDHVLQGLAGFIIVRDEEEAALDLPRTYGVDDIPVVIQTKTFTQDKQIVLGTNNLDTVVLANATRNAFVNVPAQMVRLRLLNGASQRIFNFGLSNNAEFNQISSDGGLLNAPVALTRLMLAPGERADIIVDLNGLEGQNIQIRSFSSEMPTGYYGAAQVGMNAMMSIPGYNNNPLNGSDFDLLDLQVVAPTNDPVVTIPQSLVSVTPWDVAEVDETRLIQFSPKNQGPANMVNGPFVFNDESFDITVVNHEILLNNVEVWELRNQSMIAHPFHIHDIQFYILDRNGSPVPLNEQGRKDVVVVPPMNGTVRFITKFETFADEDIPYMYHCHMLTHEDEGMMGQFIVKDLTSSTNKDQLQDDIKIYPNPVGENLHISLKSTAVVKIFDAKGVLLKELKTNQPLLKIDMSNYQLGMYMINITTDGGMRSKVITKL